MRVLVLLVLVLLGGCARGAEAPAGRAFSVEELARRVGCAPEFQGRGRDFRQAACATGDARFMIFDFRSDAGKRAWLDAALVYGGTYLVGERWVLTASVVAELTRLRGEVGGTIEGGPDLHH